MGAGPGTSIWALLNKPIKKLTLLEKDFEFVKLGKELAPEVPFEITWFSKNLFKFQRICRISPLLLFIERDFS